MSNVIGINNEPPVFIADDLSEDLIEHVRQNIGAEPVKSYAVAIVTEDGVRTFYTGSGECDNVIELLGAVSLLQRRVGEEAI